MSTKITDTTFGLNHQALAVLHYMTGLTPDFADYNERFCDYDVNFQTKPWYNGRECGFMLSMQRNFSGKTIHIAVFEHRNSDNICCLKWINDHFYWNGYDGDFEDAYGKCKNKYDVAFKTSNGEVGKVADWIYSELDKFYTELKNDEVKAKEPIAKTNKNK